MDKKEKEIYKDKKPIGNREKIAKNKIYTSKTGKFYFIRSGKRYFLDDFSRV